MKTGYHARGYPLLMALVLSALWSAPYAFAGEAAMGEGAAPGALDGKVFAIETGEKGKKAEGKDTLTFRDGRFHSQDCDRYGFGDAPYTASREGDAIRFVSETTSPKKGKIRWEGTVRGDAIDVRYVWTDASHWYKPNPKPLEKWGKGKVTSM